MNKTDIYEIRTYSKKCKNKDNCKSGYHFKNDM